MNSCFRGLADTDSDGKMDINEFSIACKLINLKLRAFEIPKKLPPVLLASLAALSGAGAAPPAAAMGMPQISPMSNHRPTPMVAAQIPPGRPPMPSHPIIAQPVVQQPPVSNMMARPPPMSAVPPPIIPMQQQPMPQYTQLIDTQLSPVAQPALDLLGNAITSPIDLIGGSVVGNTVAPAPTTPQSGPPSRSMSISVDKMPIVESPGHSGVEWAVKSQAKLKYTQLFNSTDRTRSGFLTGAQARNLMMQTKLPQMLLAKIWTLSDMDSDGRLGCEEFVLAMYLCEMGSRGEVIPDVLPLALIPPSFRKGVTSRHGSIAGIPSASASRHGSVSSQGTEAVVAEADPSAGLPNQCKLIVCTTYDSV